MSNTNKAVITLISILTACLLGILASRLTVAMFSPRPENVGQKDGRLTSCPNSPNCVASIAEATAKPEQQVAPLSYQDDMETAHTNLLAILEGMPQTIIITVSPTYIHAETRSWLFGFVDDTEFSFDPNENLIHVRAASRLGYYDGDVNRVRIETIRQAFSAVPQP